VFVMISSLSVPICNSFYAKQADSEKITTFRGTLFDTLVRKSCWKFGGRNLDCWNLYSMLQISYAGCFGLSPAISAQFAFEMCGAA